MYLRSTMINLKQVIDRGIYVWATLNGDDTPQKAEAVYELGDDYVIHIANIVGEQPFILTIPRSNFHVMWRSKIELVDKNDLLICTLECTGVDFYNIALGKES